MKEAIKAVIYPHGAQDMGNGEIAYKYVVAAVIISSKKMLCPSETVVMAETKGEFITLLDSLPKNELSFKLGEIGSALIHISGMTLEDVERQSK